MKTYDPTLEIEAENPCPNCNSSQVSARFVAGRHWRGWVVLCLDCGEETEYDEAEEPAEHRSAER